MKWRRVGFVCVLATLRSRAVIAQLPDSVVQSGAAALAEFADICARPSSALWGASLCGPMLLVNPQTRTAIANRAAPSGVLARRDGVFVGALPATVEIANTAVSWDGARWTMVLLPLSRDSFDRARLLAHESFHRIQEEIGVPMRNVLIPQLEERDARYWLRLQLLALSEAQRDSNARAERRAISDALLFRGARHALFPGIDSLEATLEMSEGLAEYTGVIVAARARGMTTFDAAEWERRSFERLPTFVRSYGYGVGPALGLALDRCAPGWRDHVRGIQSLGAELVRQTGWIAPRALLDSARTRAAAYDAARVAAEEDRRAITRAAQQAEFRARLIDGPVVVFRQSWLGGAFNPNTIVPLGDSGLVYPRRTVNADWGELSVTSGGLLVSSDRQLARVTAVGISTDTVRHSARGDGWELSLAPGWVIRPGVRRGDFEVVQGKSP